MIKEGKIRDVPGSSPHAWGTHTGRRPAGVPRRFIPTRVGNTSTSVRPWRPRNGSSPHAWGTLHTRSPHIIRWRFIPTRVGNTRPSRPAPGGTSVHPNTRGEHVPEIDGAPDERGSSPHAWGTLTRFDKRQDITRVHPHTRGEHLIMHKRTNINFGSSPHAWGTHIWRYVAPL